MDRRVSDERNGVVSFTVASLFVCLDGILVVLESYGQSQVEIAVHISGRRVVSEENHTGFPTFLLQRGQQAQAVLGILLGVEGKDLHESKIAQDTLYIRSKNFSLKLCHSTIVLPLPRVQLHTNVVSTLANNIVKR